MKKDIFSTSVKLITIFGLGYCSAEALFKLGLNKIPTIDLTDIQYEMYKEALIPDTDE